ncbi:MAG: TolC family protein [Bacteroidota bacterium]
MLNKGLIYIVLLAFSSTLNAQDLLRKDEAIKIALENNFDIKSADNNVAVARNNADIKNSRYLPSVSANGSANYAISDTEMTRSDGTVNNIDGIATSGYGASVGINYTVFDGFGRQNAFMMLKENYNLSELQSRFVIENVLINIFSGYYEIARLTENEINQKQTLDISRDRLKRSRYGSDFGQNTQLDVLNAEVDYNTDSISYLTIVQQLENEKRNLNLLLGRDIEVTYEVDTTIAYASDITLKTIQDKARTNNVTLLMTQSGIRNAELNIKNTSASAIPKLGLNASYAYNYSNRGVTSFVPEMTNIGPSVGLSLSWNIFDGGATNIRKQNSKIALDNQGIALEQTELALQRNVSNAWNVYETALFILEAERTNLRTNQLNFNRSAEQHSLGQISSIEFRQAQLNLLNAKLNYNRAKYSAKIAELALFQLSGDLLEIEF